MPRGRPKAISRPPLPLSAASSRLKMLEKAGLTEDKLGALLAKIAAQAELYLNDPELDPFAKAAWAKMMVRDIMDVRPPKATSSGVGSQVPVIINIGEQPPSPGRKRQAPDAAQAPVVIDVPPNVA